MSGILETKYFLPLLAILGLVSFFYLDFLPAYTALSIPLLILPSIFFLCRKESVIDLKKMSIISVIAILMGIIWDHVAMKLDIWNFPQENIIGWFLGIPIEEYIFAVGFSVIIVGIYTSVPSRKGKKMKTLHLPELPLLVGVFVLQLFVWLSIFFGDPSSYLKWLLFLVILPSVFYVWRKGEKIDEFRMCVTALAMIFLTFVADWLFIRAGSWFHHNDALLGTIGIVPIDDILFGVFVSISVVGFYTSLPDQNILRGKW